MIDPLSRPHVGGAGRVYRRADAGAGGVAAAPNPHHMVEMAYTTFESTIEGRRFTIDADVSLTHFLFVREANGDWQFRSGHVNQRDAYVRAGNGPPNDYAVVPCWPKVRRPYRQRQRRNDPGDA